LRDLGFSIFFVERPKASQVTLVNGAMLPYAELQFAVDLARERFHRRWLKHVEESPMGLWRHHFAIRQSKTILRAI
jgi:hypothetical protein